MAFIPLRPCLSSAFIQRFYFFSSRLSSGKPVTELVKGISTPQDHIKLQTTRSRINLESLMEISSNSNTQNIVDSGSVLHPSQASNKESFESLVSKADIKASGAVHILIKLRSLFRNGDIDPSTFINNSRFMDICQTFKKECSKVRNEQLCMGLRCLLELGLSPNLELIQIIENEVLWKSRKMSVKTLCNCLDFHVRFQETNQQVQVVRALVSHIMNRWIEIEHASEVFTILNNKDQFGNQFVEKVEDKILEFADKISKDQLVLLLNAFSRHKRRSEPVLRALSYYLVQKQEMLTLRQCCDLCFTFSSLHFIDENVLSKVSVDALANIESNTSGPLVSSLLTSLGLLKWDHSGLLESCCEWIEKNPDKWRRRDWVSLVLSLAHLNYSPENKEVLLPLAVQSLMKQTENGTTLTSNVWLDVVWALAILGKATMQHLAFVLNPDFYNSLIKDEVPNSVISKLKLQNINAVAKVEFPSVKIPTLENFEDLQVPLSTVDGKTKQSIIDALQTYLPIPKYLAVNLKTNLGFNLIAEFIVDENGKPVPIVDYGVKSGITKELKHLPPNCKRIALVYLGFKDLTNKRSSITGMNALAVRLLTKLGYTVVEVPYQEYQMLKSTLQHVLYLQQKVKDTISKK